MPRQQRTYTTEFKQEAVRFVETSGKSMSQIARDLGISDSVLSHWCQQAREKGGEAFPGSGHQTAAEEEIRRLRRDLALAQQERDVLKKLFSSSLEEANYEICRDCRVRHDTSPESRGSHGILVIVV